VWLDEVRRARRIRLARMAALSLAAAVLVMSVVTWRHETAAPTDVIVAAHNGAPLRLGSAFKTDPATRTALHLASGIELRLDVNSEIAFADTSTISLVRGALFADSGSAIGPNRSIDVRTPLGTVRDIGTRFEVRLIGDLPAEAGSHSDQLQTASLQPWLPPSGGRSLRVRVRDGMVRLTTSRGTENAGRGNELVASESGEIARAKAPLTGDEWDWVTLAATPFDLDGKTLADFLAWVTREGGWELRFENEALARSASTIVISGSVEGLTPQQALRAVLATCGLTHRRNGDVVTIEAGR
jgi:ferric-dicitrate binding protein FerR (iron transport regulator)